MLIVRSEHINAHFYFAVKSAPGRCVQNYRSRIRCCKWQIYIRDSCLKWFVANLVPRWKRSACPGYVPKYRVRFSGWRSFLNVCSSKISTRIGIDLNVISKLFAKSPQNLGFLTSTKLHSLYNLYHVQSNFYISPLPHEHVREALFPTNFFPRSCLVFNHLFLLLSFYERGSFFLALVTRGVTNKSEENLILAPPVPKKRAKLTTWTRTVRVVPRCSEQLHLRGRH